MNKKELKQKYDELVADIETAQVFDGRNQGVDVYLCGKCGKQFYTRYKDKGVTPFTIKCREKDCHGTMTHKGAISEALAKTGHLVVRNLVRPTFSQLQNLSDGAIEHVLNGGLMLEDELIPEEQEANATFDKVQDLLDSLHGKDATFLFIGDKGNHFVISGKPVKIAAQIVFAMCRYPSVRQIIKQCADNYDEMNKEYGDAARNATMEHLIEQNSGNKDNQ